MASFQSSENERESIPEVRVWQAVLLQTIEEWKSGPLRKQRQAEAYLFENNIDFPEVCSRAGMDADRLRSQLAKLRDRIKAERKLEMPTVEPPSVVSIAA